MFNFATFGTVVKYYAFFALSPEYKSLEKEPATITHVSSQFFHQLFSRLPARWRALDALHLGCSECSIYLIVCVLLFIANIFTNRIIETIFYCSCFKDR